MSKLFWKRFLAAFRLSGAAVCEMSRGEFDYHDWPDAVAVDAYSWHNHVCKRCGRKFTS